MPAGVLSVGIATQDFLFALDAMPTRPEKYRAHDLAVSGGGIAANSAVAVARLGGRSLLASRLGDDGVGRDILADLATEGVDTSLVRAVPGCRSPLSAVIIDAQGERTVISHSDPALPDEAGHLLDHMPPGIGAVLADTRWQAAAWHLLDVARRAGAIAMLDMDRPPADAGLLAVGTHLVASLQAARELTGVGDPASAARELVRFCPGWVAVTDGPRGLWSVEEGGVTHHAAFPVVAVDTLGAGDVFHGALALRLAEGLPMGPALRFAAAAAALKCTRFGGRGGYPTRPEVEAFLSGA